MISDEQREREQRWMAAPEQRGLTYGSVTVARTHNTDGHLTVTITAEYVKSAGVNTSRQSMQLSMGAVDELLRALRAYDTEEQPR